MIKQCQWCEQEFEAKGRAKYCSNEHYKECENCGNSFLIKKMKDVPKACSQACSHALSHIRDADNKQCLLCFHDFIPKNKNQKFCQSPHPYFCFHCHQEINPTPKEDRADYACKKSECRMLLTKKTNMEKYGVENVSQTSEVKKKISDKRSSLSQDAINAIEDKRLHTMKSKYGVEHPLQSLDVKEKLVKTNLERYGVENVALNREIQEKVKQTNREKYGVDYSFQAAEVQEKISITNEEKYGHKYPRQNNPDIKHQAEQTNLKKYGHINPFGSHVITDTMKSTNRKKYGVEYNAQRDDVKKKIKQAFIDALGTDNPMKNIDVQEKVKQTNREKYGYENPMHNQDIRAKMIDTIQEKYGADNISYRNVENYDNYLLLEEYVEENPSTIKDLAIYFNTTESSIRRKIRSLELDEHVIGRYVSSSLEEKFVQDVVKKLPHGTVVLRNDKKVLLGKEIDFYFPEHQLGVEISPTSTHNTLVGWGNKESHIDKNYHKNKFLESSEKGVELITIFDWMDWDKTTSLILHKLQGSNQRIYARKCRMTYDDTVSMDDIDLINSWHVLGLPRNISKKSHSISKLVFNDSVVGMVLWNRYRENVYELKRLVFKPGISVVGGASKLLKSFVKMKDDLDFDEVFTFSDCDLGTGEIYKKLGFSLVEESSPQLNYYHDRYHWHIKHLSLVKQGADRLLKKFPNYQHVGVGNDLPSNKDIVLQNGFLPVYDCGYRKWVLEVR